MDINEVLERLRLALQMSSGTYDGLLEDFQEAQDAFEALDGWLSKGGCLPDAWVAG